MLYQATRDDLLCAISDALFFKRSKELQKMMETTSVQSCYVNKSNEGSADVFVLAPSLHSLPRAAHGDRLELCSSVGLMFNYGICS